MNLLAEKLRTTVYLIVSTILLALLFRTWLMMGLIEPVVVAGSSMAPHLRGSHAIAWCPDCKATYEVGAEYAWSTGLVCASCGSPDLSLEKTLHGGDFILLDRSIYRWRDPHRWELVVLRDPTDGTQLCVKRVVGLPGECVEVRDGDIWIDGKRSVKPIDAQRELRIPIKLNGRPITDSLSYNAGLSRRVEGVRDLMVTANLQIKGPGRLEMRLVDGREHVALIVELPSWKVRWRGAKTDLNEHELEGLVRDPPETGEFLLELSSFDGQLLLAVDGAVIFRETRKPRVPTLDVEQSWKVNCHGEVHLSELHYYRDVHYIPDSERRGGLAEFSAKLGEDEFFLLGDNPPVSIDSRRWGPVSGEFLIGKPIPVR